MAKRTKAKKKAEPAAEPFFRPFSKLAQLRAKKADDKKASAPAPAPQRAAKHAPKTAPPAPQRVAKPVTKGDDAPPREVDAQTFALYMAGVRALPDRANRIPATASRIEKAAKSTVHADELEAEARARMRSLVSEGLRFETIDDGEHLEGRRLDIDRRELRRLRRGQYAVDGKLDLHGLGLPEARQAVESFVKKRAHDGDRVVVIVHGKGSHSPRGVSVLRGEIAAWLSQGRSARHTAAFATAPDEHGGTGAVLVLLAR